MGPIIKSRNIGPEDRAKQSIGSFTAKSWKDVDDSSKTMIKGGIINSIYAQMSKEGKIARTKTVLDALRYTEGGMGVGTAIEIARKFAKPTKGVQTPGLEFMKQAEEAKKVLGLFIEDLYNGSRR